MCIIAYYKKGTRPSKERIDYMIKRNPDGVGIGYNDGKRVYFTKGLVNADGVYNFIKKIEKHANDIVFHARIATSGGISAEKCHPFLVTTDPDLIDIKTYAGREPIAFHNGVFSLTPETGYNDTQTLIMKAIAPLKEQAPDGLREGDFDDLLTFTTRNNRFVLMYPDRVRLYGEWTEDDGGVMYSNENYKPHPYTGRAYAWDDIDDGYLYGGKNKYNDEWWRKHGYRAKGGTR
jgi:hypothetical protein